MTLTSTTFTSPSSVNKLNKNPSNPTRPPFLRALTFSDEEYAEAGKNKNMLELRIHVIQICDLRCNYCFTYDLYTKKQSITPRDPRPTLTFEEICDVVEQAKDVGVKTIHILGPGEPLLYKKLPDLIKFVHSHGMRTYFPTNTLTLTKEFAQFVLEHDCDMMGKFNSLDSKIEAELVGKKGSHEIFVEKLQMLVDLGFTKENRLAAHCIVTKLNYDQVPGVLIYMRERGIIPFIDTLTMTGKATDALDVTEEEKTELFERLAEIDRTMFGYDWKREDFPHIGDDYRRYLHVCVVNSYGDIYPTDCLRVKLGLNIRSAELEKSVRSIEFT